MLDVRKNQHFFSESLGFSKHTKGLKYRNFRQKFVKISDCRAFCFFNDEEKESDHEGTRTLNLPIRSRTPYPLGHAANHLKAVIFNSSITSGEKLKPVSCKYLRLVTDIEH